jgi:hypothetical protein
MDLLLHDNWVRDLDWDFDGVWDLDFLDDWHLDDLVLWHLLVVVLVNGVDWNFDASNVMFLMSASMPAWEGRCCRYEAKQGDLWEEKRE